MELYYQGQTLYIEMKQDLNRQNYETIKKRIFKIIDDYKVNRIIMNNTHHFLKNKILLKHLKQDYNNHYYGTFLIK